MTLKELKLLIRKAATIYYTGEWEGTKYNEPIMSDAQFDQYVNWLRSLDPTAEELKKTGWGYSPESVSGDKVRHAHGGMDSIDNKPRDIEDVPMRLRSNVRISAKLDGLSGKVEFKDGRFIRCVTRGNGELGIDKTDKFQYILNRVGGHSVPESFTGEIRGEFVISQQNWNKMLEEGSDKSHPRNAASGLIGADDIQPHMKYLDFIPYKIIWDPSAIAPLSLNDGTGECLLCTWFPQFPSLPKMFFREGYTLEELKEMYESWLTFWPMDGLVITANNVSKSADGCYLYDEVAFKFESLKKITVVEGIDWQISKHSKLTPVANLKPVEIDGAMISRVTLNNAANVEALRIVPGAEVEIMRSGGVIPYLTQVVSVPEHSYVALPEVCPVCGEDLHRKGVDIVCVNPQCGNAGFQNLRIWINQLGAVDGIADTLLTEYLNRFEIDSIDKLYATSDTTFEVLKSEGVQSNKFLAVIDKLKNSPVPFKQYLLALNIPRLGDVSAKKLAATEAFIHCIQQLIAGHEVDSAMWQRSIEPIVGEATCATITENLDKFNTLEHVKDRLVFSASAAASDDAVPVCITGTLSRPRKTIVAMLEAAGYVVKEDVTKKTRYLITNDLNGTSGKHKRANELGTEKITEENLMKILQN